MYAQNTVDGLHIPVRPGNALEGEADMVGVKEHLLYFD